MHKSLNKYFPIFVLPTLVAFFVAFIIPFVMGWTLSFAKFRRIKWDRIEWVGFDNYLSCFKDTQFIGSLKLSVVFAITTVLAINVVAFTLAVMLTKRIFGTNVYRTIFFMPNLIGGIVLGYLSQLIVNEILEIYNGSNLSFSEKYGFWGMVAVLAWQQAGYMMIIYIAGIQNIPLELVEAAKIDGASGLQVLKNVTVPMVMPSITICLFLTIANGFKLFDLNLSLTGGGPLRKSELVAMNIFQTYNAAGMHKGEAQAKAVLFFLIVATISFIQIVVTRRKEVQN